MKLFSDTVVLPDGRVFYVPSDSLDAIVLNPNTGTLTKFPIDTKPNKFSRGLLLPDGRVVCIPYQKEHLFLLQPDEPNDILTQGVKARPDDFSDAEILYSDAVLLTDGRVMLVPYDVGYLRIWDSIDNTFQDLRHDKIEAPDLRGQILPDGTVFLVSKEPGYSIYLWNPEDPDSIIQGPVWNVGIKKMSLDDRGFVIALTSSDPPNLLRWSINSGPIDSLFTRFVS